MTITWHRLFLLGVQRRCCCCFSAVSFPPLLFFCPSIFQLSPQRLFLSSFSASSPRSCPLWLYWLKIKNPSTHTHTHILHFFVSVTAGLKSTQTHAAWCLLYTHTGPIWKELFGFKHINQLNFIPLYHKDKQFKSKLSLTCRNKQRHRQASKCSRVTVTADISVCCSSADLALSFF